MTLSELLLLLTLLAAVGSLIISVVNTTFVIAWNVSHDRQNDDNKKSELPPSSSPTGYGYSLFVSDTR